MLNPTRRKTTDRNDPILLLVAVLLTALSIIFPFRHLANLGGDRAASNTPAPDCLLDDFVQVLVTMIVVPLCWRVLSSRRAPLWILGISAYLLVTAISVLLGVLLRVLLRCLLVNGLIPDPSFGFRLVYEFISPQL